MTRLFAAAALIALTACTAMMRQTPTKTRRVVVASSDTPVDPKATGGSGPKGRFTCGLETPTGSHQPQRVCRYDDDDAASTLHRQQTQEAFEAARGTPFHSN